jgi:hypothetical protein
MSDAISSPQDCVILLNYLKTKFLLIQSDLEISLSSLTCYGQVAIDLIDKNVYLADQWIKEWSEDDRYENDSLSKQEGYQIGQDNEINSTNDQKQSLKSAITRKNSQEKKDDYYYSKKVLSFYDFLVLCEIFVDSNPDIAEGVKEIERLFLPICPLVNDSKESRPNTSNQSNKPMSRRNVKRSK